MDWGRLISTLAAGVAPVLPQLLAVLAAILVISCPLPGRGPRLFQRAGPWRVFKYETRRQVMSRAGHRCEGAVFLAWGRCREAATEADHVYPWSRGGPPARATDKRCVADTTGTRRPRSRRGGTCCHSNTGDAPTSRRERTCGCQRR